MSMHEYMTDLRKDLKKSSVPFPSKIFPPVQDQGVKMTDLQKISDSERKKEGFTSVSPSRDDVGDALSTQKETNYASHAESPNLDPGERNRLWLTCAYIISCAAGEWCLIGIEDCARIETGKSQGRLVDSCSCA